MNITNSKLNSINNDVNDIFSDFKNGRIKEPALYTKADLLKSEINSEIIYVENKINKAKYPFSSQRFSTESLKIGEMQKIRATALKDAPISLVKSSLAKEIKLGNNEFCFELIELIFSSDRSDGEKSQLSREYSELKNVTQLGSFLDEFKQAQILKKQIESLIEHAGDPDAVNKSEMVRATEELKYERKKDVVKPDYQTYNEGSI
jgi:hypothetical protein